MRQGGRISFVTDCPEKEPTLVIHGMEEVSVVEGGVKVVRKLRGERMTGKKSYVNL